MSKTLSANDMSFKARTIGVYQDDAGQPLHIFQTTLVTHRPDRLAVHLTGDRPWAASRFAALAAALPTVELPMEALITTGGRRGAGSRSRCWCRGSFERLLPSAVSLRAGLLRLRSR